MSTIWYIVKMLFVLAVLCVVVGATVGPLGLSDNVETLAGACGGLLFGVFAPGFKKTWKQEYQELTGEEGWYGPFVGNSPLVTLIPKTIIMAILLLIVSVFLFNSGFILVGWLGLTGFFLLTGGVVGIIEGIKK